MKDYIITIVSVFLIMLGILLCHKYTLNIDYDVPEISSEPVANTVPYNQNYIPNNFESPAVTTVSSQNKGLKMFQSTVQEPSETAVFTDVPDYGEYDETETTTTVRRSILENATVKATVHQFSIIQNPQIPQTETTPAAIPDDFSLVIN